MKRNYDEEKRLGKLLKLNRKQIKKLKQDGKYDFCVENVDIIELCIFLNQNDDDNTEEFDLYQSVATFNKKEKLTRFLFHLIFVIVILVMLFVIHELFETQKLLNQKILDTTFCPNK